MRFLIKLGRVLAFMAFYLRSLVAANLRIAAAVLRPKLKIRPGFIRVPLESRTDTEVLILSNLVTMTPGTLSLDVSPDRRLLYVHVFDREARLPAKKSIGQNLQQRVLKVLR